MSDILKKDPTASEPLGEDERLLQVGQWYWIKYQKSDKEPWFGCIVHLGSNYAELKSPGASYTRVLLEEFDQYCTFEPHPDQVIESNVKKQQSKVVQLMGEVQALTARLAVAPSPELTQGGHTTALAKLDPQVDFDAYKLALTEAKTSTLPTLFKKIEEANEQLAYWMTASTVPLQALSQSLKGSLKVINERIFSVELYAGLIERVVQIQDGTPAALDAKVHLMQRRCYMDEECLARYEAGGMDFKDLERFDEWLARPENLERILPHPRCIVAFKVRRDQKEIEWGGDLHLFIQLSIEAKLDDKTFLYIRNGDQLFRLSTGVEFDEKLFPDMDQDMYSGKLWAKMSGDDPDEIISDREYQGIQEGHQAKLKEWRAKRKAAEAEARRTGKESEFHEWAPRLYDTFAPFDRSSVYYDDIQAKIHDDLQTHNRIALIIQGLLDRSPVLHPHPPWQIGTPEGFQQALTLVYDVSRALPGGTPPDFEAYRRRVNLALKVGSVTVGQEDLWLLHEGQKESDRRANDWRHRGETYRPKRFEPYGNPGPGLVARVAEYAPRSKMCTFRWTRERLSHDRWGPKGRVPTKFKVSADKLLNIDAYTPGDFRQFFDDPRTRQDYLRWAPLLLTAEDYYAGKVKLDETKG